MKAIAFEELFEDLFVEACHVARRVVGDRNEAEDIAAETMARALERWRLVGRMGSPTGWVVRVARNLAIDTVRRRRFVAAGVADDSVHADDVDGHLALWDLCRNLPRRQRDVVMLRYLVDLSEIEIASILGISPGSVKQHACRALARLRCHDLEAMTQRTISAVAS